ncbi:hypothetical protein [Streptomyces boncukensis]|uniref:Uncharacterized protein n=1 Tax=Streptomyces boncukensis TaxID=2711219 RepID=A0A6G4X1K1_9ACTN|nr:hypothetical protein [Streptomyces boncukensis]NGO71133.1 hypothetical protein [Streptomyces boncukensis]
MANIPTDLLDRIRELERQVRDLMGSANSAPPLNQISGGDVVIGDGGRLRVCTGLGEDLFYLGRVEPDRAAGAPQQGMVVRRDDGSLALTVRTASPDMTPAQPVQIFDRTGNVVFADDARRKGLARPYVPYPLPAPADPARWAATGAVEWTTLYRGAGQVQHPRLRCRIDAEGDAGAAVRLLADGEPVGPEGGPDGLRFTAPLAAEYGAEVTLEIQARVASAGDTVRCVPLALYGVQS